MLLYDELASSEGEGSGYKVESLSIRVVWMIVIG